MYESEKEDTLRCLFHIIYGHFHGLRTPNEGTNQRYLKIWADAQTKYAPAVTKNLGVGVDFGPCREGDFLTGRT